MKVQCENCNKKFSSDEGLCPHCGAYNSTSRNYSTHSRGRPPSQPNPQPAAASGRQRRRILPGIIASVLVSVILAVVPAILARVRDGGEAGGVETPPPGLTQAELWKELEQSPRDFDVLLELMKVQCAAGRFKEAWDLSGALFRESCRDAAYFRRAAELLEKNDARYACRLYLGAYSVSGLQSDLDLATRCETPASLMTEGPTTQALEFLFHEPMGKITWEDVGKVKYFSLHADYIEVSLTAPGSVPEHLFADTVRTVPFESSETVGISALYGLTSLEIHATTDFGALNLQNMLGLRELHITRAWGAHDLTPFANTPSLEALHVGGTEIDSLGGLELLPNLRSLSLEGTSIDNLSILATYRGIEHLSLNNNEELSNINTLGMMDHLKTLRVQRQDILDFGFLQKFYAIEELALIDTGIKDIFFLSELTTLKSLTLYDNSQLTSIAGIGALERLERLRVSCGKTDGLEEIGRLFNLRELELGSPRSLDMLSGLNIEVLTIYNPGLLDTIAPLSTLTELRTLSIDAFGPSSCHFSLTPLAGLPGLTVLRIPGADILGDASAIFSISTLEYLDLTQTGASIGPAGLAGLKNVKTLKLDGFKPLTNLSVVSDGFITSVDYDVADPDWLAGTLAGLENLESLAFSGNGLTDLSFVPALPALETLDVSDNYITDISVLGEAPSLAFVDLSGNPVRDWAPSEAWTGVYVARR